MLTAGEHAGDHGGGYDVGVAKVARTAEHVAAADVEVAGAVEAERVRAEQGGRGHEGQAG